MSSVLAAGVGDQPRGWYLGAGPAEFERHYLAQLERHGARQIARRFAEISRENDHPALIAVCCFEQLPGDCHRGISVRGGSR